MLCTCVWSLTTDDREAIAKSGGAKVAGSVTVLRHRFREERPGFPFAPAATRGGASHVRGTVRAAVKDETAGRSECKKQQ